MTMGNTNEIKGAMQGKEEEPTTVEEQKEADSK
jgi:hypothetical protein